MQWYRQMHIAKIDGLPFDKPKPAKYWAETFSQTQSLFVNKLEGKGLESKEIAKASKGRGA